MLLGNGDGTFQPNVEYTVGIGPTGVGIGDFNGDGKIDLAVGTQCGNSPTCENMGIDSLSILLGNGDGTFQSQMMPALTGPQGLLGGITSMTIGDLNGDGLLDLIAARTISVNLQSTLSIPIMSLAFGTQTVGTSSSPLASTLSNISTKLPLSFSGRENQWYERFRFFGNHELLQIATQVCLQGDCHLHAHRIRDALGDSFGHR